MSKRTVQSLLDRVTALPAAEQLRFAAQLLEEPNRPDLYRLAETLADNVAHALAAKRLFGGK